MGYEEAWEGDMAISGGNLYNTSETYKLDTLRFSKADEIGEGGCGNIFKGTITRSYGVQHRLYSGMWPLGRGPPQDSYEHFSGSTPAGATEKTITVAVKTIRSSEDEVIELTREASNLRVLQGTRNIASVYGVTYNKEMKSVCVVMELVHGVDLNSFLRSGKLASPSSWDWWKTKLEIFMELVIGLSVCHQRGVYHGDLKGKNVLVDERFTVPKLIDFGFSFRKKDVDYLRSLGGSPFWISPELDEAVDEIPPEVLANPFPSDVYSLGMVLVEMLIDGDIPEYMDSYLVMQKYLGMSPVELEVPEGMEDLKESVFEKLFAVVNGCCAVERDDRMSLEKCLVLVQAAYSSLCSSVESFGTPGDFNSSEQFNYILELVRARFPEVPDVIARQPAKNMMVNIKGTLLVDLFCQMNLKEGVEFIIDNGDSWDLNPEIEVPRLCRICIKHGSEKVLQFLARRFLALVAQEEWLMHEACEGDSLEVLEVLLDEVGMDYDTWDRSGHLKPFHKLAFMGKVEMMKLLLERATESNFDYVNTVVHREAIYHRRALDYAIEGDKVNAVVFLLEHGATGSVAGTHETDLLEQLFYNAMLEGSLTVATNLLETSQLLKTAGASDGSMQLSPKMLQRFENHTFGCLDFCADERHKKYEYVLPLLKNHLVESELHGMEPLSWACSKHGNAQSQEVFQMMVLLYRGGKKLWRLLGEQGNKEMVLYALETFASDYTKRILRTAAIQHGNAEIVDLLGPPPSEEKQLPSDANSKTNNNLSNADVHKVCKRALESFLLEESKLQQLCLCSSTPADYVAEVLKAVESLEGTEIIDKLEEKVAKAGIWTSLVAGELLKSFAYLGSLEMVEHLLLKEVPLDGPLYTDGFTGTPLMRAVSGNHYEIAKKLLLAGADPNARMNAGYSCMDIALGRNNAKVARLLIKFGFDTGTKDLHNRTYMDEIANL